MLPRQILLVNILSDCPMIAIATDNVDIKDLRRPQKTNVKSIVYVSLGMINACADFILVWFFHTSPALLQTNWFIENMLTELLLIFSLRSTRPFFRAPIPSFWLLFLTCTTIIITIVIPYTFLGTFFAFTVPQRIGIIITITTVYFFVTDYCKVKLYQIIAPIVK